MPEHEAVMRIRWMGPEEKVREWLSDRFDQLFEDMTFEFGEELMVATGAEE